MGTRGGETRDMGNTGLTASELKTEKKYWKIYFVETENNLLLQLLSEFLSQIVTIIK